MSKQEFLRELERSLAIKGEEKDEVMRYYTEYFEEAGPENEQAVLEELGDPKMLAEKLNAECKTEDSRAEETRTENFAWREAIDEAEMALREAEIDVREAEQELKDAERELRSAQREAASARRGDGREGSRNAESIIDESLRFAERTTRSVFTSLKDIFGGGQTDKEIHEFSNHDMEPFHTIRVDVENCPVTIALSRTNRYGVDAKFVAGDQSEWEINVVDGTLIVTKHTSRRMKIQFGFSGNSGKNSEYVRIYLPKVAMDIVELISSNASIQVEDVCTQTLIAETSNAVIRITDTKVLGELRADTSNGGIGLSRVEGDNITLDTSNGMIELEQVTGRTLNADTSNGAIRAKQCEFNERIFADTSNGSIEIQLTGTENEYTIHADTSNAKIYVDGRVRGDEYHSHGGAKEVRLDTSNGRITIGFTGVN